MLWNNVHSEKLYKLILFNLINFALTRTLRYIRHPPGGSVGLYTIYDGAILSLDLQSHKLVIDYENSVFKRILYQLNKYKAKTENWTKKHIIYFEIK